MTELFDSWGIPVQTRVYFTFTYDKKDYVYADELFSDEEEPEGECSRLGWGILRGAHIKTEEPSEDALKFCRTILARAEKEPEKYPLLFNLARALVLNKVDLLPHVDFDMARARAFASRLNKDLDIFELSCRSGEGL